MLQTPEQPWHLRRVTAKHEHWFRGLVDWHELTRAWVGELAPSENPRSLYVSRGFDHRVSENLWMLESLADARLEALLDDTYPEDTLARLERTVWAAQAYTLMTLLERSREEDQPAVYSKLESVSWKQGIACAGRRWPHGIGGGAPDLRTLWLALGASPFVPSTLEESFLVRRVVRAEARLELRRCPHRQPYEEVRPVADLLCRLHAQFLRGFLYALCPPVAVESEIAEPRCRQDWTLSARA
jgi:hypothetical protein